MDQPTRLHLKGVTQASFDGQQTTREKLCQVCDRILREYVLQLPLRKLKSAVSMVSSKLAKKLPKLAICQGKAAFPLKAVLPILVQETIYGKIPGLLEAVVILECER